MESELAQKEECLSPKYLVISSQVFLTWNIFFCAGGDNVTFGPHVMLTKNHCTSHLDPPANGQAVIYLTGLLEVFIFSESFILATVSDNSVRYQAINVVKR